MSHSDSPELLAPVQDGAALATEMREDDLAALFSSATGTTITPTEWQLIDHAIRVCVPRRYAVAAVAYLRAAGICRDRAVVERLVQSADWLRGRERALRDHGAIVDAQSARSVRGLLGRWNAAAAAATAYVADAAYAADDAAADVAAYAAYADDERGDAIRWSRRAVACARRILQEDLGALIAGRADLIKLREIVEAEFEDPRAAAMPPEARVAMGKLTAADLRPSAPSSAQSCFATTRCAMSATFGPRSSTCTRP